MLIAASVAFAADDGSYRPEHQYNNRQHHVNNLQYYGAANPHAPYLRAYVPQIAYQPIARISTPQYQYQPFVQQSSISPDGHWQTLRSVHAQSPSGDYTYEYETQNGIVAQEQSQVVDPKTQRKTGFYQYPSPDGRIIRVDYVADENGFHATGDHLPQAPAIPEVIAQSIAYNLGY